MGQPPLLSVGQERSLRFLVAVGSATRNQVISAAIAAARPKSLESFPLSGFIGGTTEVSDLEALGLVRSAGDQMYVTDQGRRMLASIDSQRTPPKPQPVTETAVVFVGRPSSPAFYADILLKLGSMEDVLFVDPYLAAVDLRVVAEVETVTRVLTSAWPVIDRGEARNDSAGRIRNLRIAAGISSTLELRISSSIHDRYALPTSGKGYMIGASMGSSKSTALVELSEEGTAQLREGYDTVWDEAELAPSITAPGPSRLSAD